MSASALPPPSPARSRDEAGAKTFPYASAVAPADGGDICPYPGLRAFFTHERDWYFGREQHVDAMLTCLESERFLAVVGASGSGKSSLVFAGLIPALREGQLAGSRRDSEGDPAPWTVVSFHPGNDPLEELAAAILLAVPEPKDPHLGGYVRAALDSSEGGLLEALKIAGLVNEESELLVYADQFEELFRFGEKSGRSAQEKALRFARLFVVAAERKDVRLHLLLSMRSEFIGECDRFPGLPEIVSASQFLTPRLSRRQLEQSLGCPAEAAGAGVASDALTAIINDCGNSPDQLPLAQHVLRRMWMRAGSRQPNEALARELTLEDYRAVGGIENSIAEHGNEILKSLPEPVGLDVARLVFMALCEQREEGPLVRRLSSREEAEAIAGQDRALVPVVLAAFGGDDPGFIREEKGYLDIRHEAILRQWPLIGQWLAREEKSEAWLRELSLAAHDYERETDQTELWHGKDLAGAEEWISEESPSEPWAVRHSIRNWDKCLSFMALSRAAESAAKKAKEEAAREAQEEKERRQRRLLTGIGAVAVVSFLTGLMMFTLWKRAGSSERRATDVIKAYADTADDLATPIVSAGKSALADAEQQTAKLIAAMGEAATDEPPEPAAVAELVRSRDAAQRATDAINNLAQSLRKAAQITGDKALAKKADEFEKEAADAKVRHDALVGSGEAKAAVEKSIATRLAHIQQALGGLLEGEKLDPAIVQEKDQEILAATADVTAIKSIQKTAGELGFPEQNFPVFAERLDVIAKTLASARDAKGVSAPEGRLAEWKQSSAEVLTLYSKVNRFRFALSGSGSDVFAAAVCEDGSGTVWTRQRKVAATIPGKEALADLAFSPSGDAIAVAGTGSSVRVVKINAKGASSFERHSDSVTDVEFSHGGERIASAGADRTVRVFDSRSMAQLYFTSPPLGGIVTSVEFHLRDNLVVSGSDDGGVRLHTIEEPSVNLLGRFEAPARRPEFSSDGNLVVAASGDRTARVWSIRPRTAALKQDDASSLIRVGMRPETSAAESAARFQILRVDHPAPLTQATFRPGSSATDFSFITCATSGEVRMIRGSALEPEPRANIVLEPRHAGPAVAAKWSANGRWLATIGGGEVLLWEGSGEIPIARARLTGLPPTAARVEFSADNTLLATYGGNNNVALWDLAKIPAR